MFVHAPWACIVGSKKVSRSETVVHLAQVCGSSEDVGAGVVRVRAEPVAARQLGERRRHDLHQSHGTCGRGDRAAVDHGASAALDPHHAAHPGGRDTEPMRRFFDQRVKVRLRERVESAAADTATRRRSLAQRWVRAAGRGLQARRLVSASRASMPHSRRRVSSSAGTKLDAAGALVWARPRCVPDRSTSAATAVTSAGVRQLHHVHSGFAFPTISRAGLGPK